MTSLLDKWRASGSWAPATPRSNSQNRIQVRLHRSQIIILCAAAALTLLASFHVGIISILAMTGSNSAIGALVLVPIAIVLSVVFIALKTSQLSTKVTLFFRRLWDIWSPWVLWSQTSQTRRRRKLRRSNLSTIQIYGDSWCDLRSADSRERLPNSAKANKQRCSSSHHSNLSTPYDEESAEQTWHPSRSTRLNWSFINPRSRSPHLFGSSNVVKPSPVAQPPTNHFPDGEGRPARQLRAHPAYHMQKIDHYQYVN